jgi:hypothetical protein
MSAVISECGTYRYALSREFSEGKGRLLFVMLNPSTADAASDDPTIRRCAGFARQDGFSALDVANVFAFRATDPRALFRTSDPVGPENDSWLKRLAGRADKIILAWGNLAPKNRADGVVRLLRGPELRPLFALRITKVGAPQHPLYVAKSTCTVLWPL